MLKSQKNISDIIRSYTAICDNLLFTSPEHIKRITGRLHERIDEQYGFVELCTKEDLLNKAGWINHARPSFKAQTSGTTSGQNFQYMIDSEFYPYVEFDCRYKTIIKDFKINCRNILFFLKTNIDSAQNVIKNNTAQISSHGTIGTRTHYLNWSKDLNENIENAVKYLKEHQIDVVLTDGSLVNILARYARKNNIKNKLCTLLSSTNEKLIRDDAEFLLSNGNVSHWCDHMRCWDGGASFMTCPYYTYHLLENLSYVKTINSKMVSTDYFNLASPFVNYWNGDYCEIGDDYKLCMCGRWYREFKMLETRSWIVHGISSNDIGSRIQSLKISGIKQVRCDDRSISIVSENLSNDNQRDIIKSLPEFTVYFVNE
jgi:phenylacetate-coenzyme A ligase PaaK-like adenylate-forming protein